jgi:hypothetical protein
MESNFCWQVIGLAQAGYEVTPDILKNKGAQKPVTPFFLFQ